MNPPPPPRRHRLWPWILGLALTPFVVLGLTIASAIRLNGDAAALRQQVMTAMGDDWHAKVQFSIPPAVVSLARTAVWFVHDVPPQAREALRAVRFASVGVYERHGPAGAWRRDQVIAETDQVMARRGWARVVGVVDGRDTVLIYLSEGRASAKPSRVCLAVCSGQDLVVVAAGFDADTLARLITREIGTGRLARL
jgi:hypothetical protein